jgi:hypothetical protein
VPLLFFRFQNEKRAPHSKECEAPLPPRAPSSAPHVTKT